MNEERNIDTREIRRLHLFGSLCMKKEGRRVAFVVACKRRGIIMISEIEHILNTLLGLTKYWQTFRQTKQRRKKLVQLKSKEVQ